MRLTRRSLCTAATAALVPAEARAQGTTGTLALGTRFATPWFRVDGDRPGPTVAIVAGIHGNETAPPVAADLLTRARLRRGRLWVVPEANRPALASASRFSPGSPFADLNRNFPTRSRAAPRGEMAPVLWRAVLGERPAWLLDLHEGWGFSASSASMGSSVVCAGPSPVERECLAMAARVLAEVNAVVDQPRRRFTRIRPGPSGSLARAASEEALLRSLVFETTWTQDPSLRIAQQLLMVRSVLVALDMLDA